MHWHHCFERLFRPPWFSIFRKLETFLAQEVANAIFERPLKDLPQSVVRTPQPYVNFRRNYDRLSLAIPRSTNFHIEFLLKRNWVRERCSTPFKVQQH